VQALAKPGERASPRSFLTRWPRTGGLTPIQDGAGDTSNATLGEARDSRRGLPCFRAQPTGRQSLHQDSKALTNGALSGESAELTANSDHV
jgi:hypothetical protein